MGNRRIEDQVGLAYSAVGAMGSGAIREDRECLLGDAAGIEIAAQITQ